MTILDLFLFTVIPIAPIVFVLLGQRQRDAAYRLASALVETPHKWVFLIVCIASFNGLRPYSGYMSRFVGFNFAEDGLYIVFQRGLKTIIEWYIPYGKMESFERIGKFSIGIKVQHKEQGKEERAPRSLICSWRS